MTKQEKIDAAIKLVNESNTITSGFMSTTHTYTSPTPYYGIPPTSTGIFTANTTGTTNTGIGNIAIGNNTQATGISNIAIGSKTKATVLKSNATTSNITINSNGNIGLGNSTGTTTLTVNGINNTTINSVYTGTYFQNLKYIILGEEIEMPYYHQNDLIVSLINTLGLEFWDNYRINCSDMMYVTAVDKALLKLRRDEKIDNILNER